MEEVPILPEVTHPLTSMASAGSTGSVAIAGYPTCFQPPVRICQSATGLDSAPGFSVTSQTKPTGAEPATCRVTKPTPNLEWVLSTHGVSSMPADRALQGLVPTVKRD